VFGGFLGCGDDGGLGVFLFFFRVRVFVWFSVFWVLYLAFVKNRFGVFWFLVLWKGRLCF